MKNIWEYVTSIIPILLKLPGWFHVFHVAWVILTIALGLTFLFLYYQLNKKEAVTNRKLALEKAKTQIQRAIEDYHTEAKNIKYSFNKRSREVEHEAGERNVYKSSWHILKQHEVGKNAKDQLQKAFLDAERTIEDSLLQVYKNRSLDGVKELQEESTKWKATMKEHENLSEEFEKIARKIDQLFPEKHHRIDDNFNLK